jgi:hypothetical protein
LHITGSQATIAPGLTSVVTHAAASLEISVRTLRNKLREYRESPRTVAPGRRVPPDQVPVSAPAMNTTMTSPIRAA